MGSVVPDAVGIMGRPKGRRLGSTDRLEWRTGPRVDLGVVVDRLQLVKSRIVRVVVVDLVTPLELGEPHRKGPVTWGNNRLDRTMFEMNQSGRSPGLSSQTAL